MRAKQSAVGFLYIVLLKVGGENGNDVWLTFLQINREMSL